jgi:hypothetical protein
MQIQSALAAEQVRIFESLRTLHALPPGSG